MARFQYSSIDRNGARRKGTISASGEAQARQHIAAGGELLIDIREASRRRWFALEQRSSISPMEAAAFASELAALLKAGAPLRNALEIQTKGRSAASRLARDVLKTIDVGGSLSSSLRQAGGGATLLAEFAAAGEAGAGLDTLLDKGAGFLNDRAAALSKIREALAYPLFITCLGVIALCVITLYVAPALAPMLEDVGNGGFVLLLAGLGTWLKDNSSFVFLGLAGLAGGLFFASRNRPVRRLIARIFFSLPIIRGLSRDLEVGQSCEVLAAMLDAGRPLETALRFAAATSNPVLADTWTQIAARIRDGEVLSSAFSRAQGLPPELQRLALLGERSGAFSNSIRQAGRICHTRAMSGIDRLSGILGPALVIGMGATIAALMLSILGTLSGMGDAIQ